MRQIGIDTKRTGEFSNRELIRFLGPLFRPWIWHFAGAFSLLVVVTGLMVLGPVLIKRAIDVNIGGGDLPGLRTTVLLFLLVQLGYLVTVYIMRNWLEWVGQQMMASLRKRLFGHLLKLPMSFHDRKTPGELLTRVESDTQALRMLFTTTAVMLIGDIMLFFGMFAAMAMVDVRLTLVTAIIVPFLLGTTFYFQKRIHPIFVEVRKLNSQISSKLAEFLQNISVVQAFQRQKWALARFFELNRAKYDTQVPGEKLVIAWFNLIFLLQTMAFALILGVGGYWALLGLVSIGTLVMFIGYVRRFFEPLMRLSEQLAVIQRAFASTERICLLLNEPLRIEDAETPQEVGTLKHGIKFENVSFRYADDGDWILNNVTFFLPKGESWALVGPTGSGKTTLVNLILRFYEPQEGRILVDGVDIREMQQQELRRLIGMVQQDIYLFPGDLLQNLTLGQEYSQEHIEKTAQTTLAHRFIQSLPNQYHTNMAERGVNMSLGQRQLLSFTRALLPDPEVIILDEATSAIDPATEASLVEATRRLLAGRTAFVIAHRLSTIRHCDQILVLQHGELVQQGTYQHLVETPGLFRTMHELQFADDSPSNIKPDLAS